MYCTNRLTVLALGCAVFLASPTTDLALAQSSGWTYLDRNGDPVANPDQTTEIYGTKDNATGLVWGHLSAHTITFLGYPEGSHDWHDAVALLLKTDGGTVLTDYQTFSNTWYTRTDSDWRLPSLDEVSTAVQHGLIPVWDISPASGVQTLASDPWWWNVLVWTTTQGKNWAYGLKAYYGAYLGDTYADGTPPSIRLSENSGARYVPVRGVPAVAPTKGGGKK